MTALLLAPTVVSSLILAAHFLRESNWLLVLICLLMPFLLIVRRRWVARVVQLYLVGGAMLWISTALDIAQVRGLTGMPWKRMAIILGGVAVFALFSALLFETKKLKALYASSVSK